MIHEFYDAQLHLARERFEDEVRRHRLRRAVRAQRRARRRSLRSRLRSLAGA